MEVEELHCYRLSKNFSALNSDTCSSDNDFAVIIRSGVHILSLTPNLTSSDENFNVHRSVIKPPEDYLPDISIDFGKLNREKFCILSLDWKLTATLDKSLPANIYTRQIGFISSEPPFKSLLGVISTLGRFLFYSKTRYDWEKIIDISSLWNDHWTSQWSLKAETDDFDSLSKKYKCLRIVAFTHCQGFVFDENSKALLLASISEDGTIAFWKIENKEASLINIIELGILAQTLHWHYVTDRFGWIIAACFDGSVKIYFCKKNTSNEITLTLLHELWKERDQIVASHIKIRKQGTRSLLVFSKENALLLFALKNNQIASYMHEFDKKIVGLEIMDDSCIFVILTNHQTYNLSIKNEKCVCVPIPFKTSSSFKKYAVRGVSFSRNKAFCVVSLGIARNFDPLGNKEPWCLLLCTTKKDMAYYTVESLIKETSLYKAFDYIECFRLNCIRNRTCIDQGTLVQKWSSLNEDIKDCYRNFQIVYILSQCCRPSQAADDLLSIEIVLAICNFIYHSNLMADSRRQYYFHQWLSANLPKLPKFVSEFQQIKIVSEKTTEINGYIAEEKCDICLSDITDHSNIGYILCERGHKVLRCSRSFLPVTLQPHYTCSICQSIILKSEGVLQCVICDNIL